MTCKGVLVLEHDADARELLCDALVSAGYRARSVVDGDLALASLRADGACLVFLDLDLPLLSDGRAFLDALQADPGLAGISVVATSTAMDITTPAGARTFLLKPLRLVDLTGLAREHCHQAAEAMPPPEPISPPS